MLFEKLQKAFEEKDAKAHRALFHDDHESLFGISTSNRTEIYLVGKSGISKEVLREALKRLDVKDITMDSFYFLSNHDALVHMCKVASGIDSQVLGEQEIFGQFKTALKNAKEYKNEQSANNEHIMSHVQHAHIWWTVIA